MKHPIRYDPRSGLYRVGEFSATLAIEANGVLRTAPMAHAHSWRPTPQGGILRLTFAHPDVTLTVGFRLRDRGRDLFVTGTLRNGGTQPVSLGRCFLVYEARESGWNAGRPTDRVMLDCTGAVTLNAVRRLADLTLPHRTRVHCLIANRSLRRVLFSGFVTFDRAATEHELHRLRGRRGLALSSWCDFQGYTLTPGASLATETLLVRRDADPHRTLEHWAGLVHRRYAPPVWPEAPVGWVGISWVDVVTVERPQDVMMRNAAAIARRLKGFGVRYVWNSITNLKDGLPGNWLKIDRRNFDGDIRSLVRRLKRFNLTLGLWIAPFWLANECREELRTLDKALLRMPDGEPVIGFKGWPYGRAGQRRRDKRPDIYTLDGSHPAAVAFVKRTFETYRRWGVRYFMIDFLFGSAAPPYGPDYARHHNPELIKGPQVQRHLLRAVREAAGADTYLLSAWAPNMIHTGLMNGARVADDYGEGRQLAPDSFGFYPGTFVINNSDFKYSHKNNTINLAGAYYTHRRLYLNDSCNVMTVDKPVPLSDAHITATLFAISGSPLMMGDDIGRIADERLALIKKCLPRTGPCAVPVDLFDCPHPDYPKVFRLTVTTRWDTFIVLALFNYGPTAATHTLPFAALSLPRENRYRVWDFWDERYLGAVARELRIEVPANSVRVLRLTRCRPHPWILGTDMHVLQGLAEVRDCQWDPVRKTLSFTAERPEGETGNVFIHAPPGWRAADPEGLWLAKDANDDSLIVRCSLKFAGRQTSARIRFERI